MQRSDVTLVAQVISAMKEGADKLEKAYENKDVDRLEALKKELLKLQESLESML